MPPFASGRAGSTVIPSKRIRILAELDQIKTAKAYIRETKKGWQVEAAA